MSFEIFALLEYVVLLVYYYLTMDATLNGIPIDDFKTRIVVSLIVSTFAWVFLVVPVGILTYIIK